MAGIPHSMQSHAAHHGHTAAHPSELFGAEHERDEEPEAGQTGLLALGTTVLASGELEFDEDLTAVKHDEALYSAVNTMKRHKTITYDDIVMSQGVQQSVYLEYIKWEIDTENTFLELPLTIVVLVSFTILALYILHQEQLYAIEEAFERDIIENANFAWSGYFGHKGIDQVMSVADFWSWMRLGFLSLLGRSQWLYSEVAPEILGGPVTAGTSYNRATLPQSWLFAGYDKPAPVANDHLQYSKLVSGVRMRQTVSAAASEHCIFPSLLDSQKQRDWLQKPCFPSELGLLSPELQEAENFQGLERQEFLFPDISSMSELTRKLLDMEDGCHSATLSNGLGSCLCEWCKQQTPSQPWIDERTARIEISMLLFNAQYGAYTYLSVNFMMNRGGHIHAFTHCLSAFVSPFLRPFSELVLIIIAGILWIAALLYAAVAEIWEIINTVRHSSKRFYKSLWQEYLGFWNFVDWMSVLVGTLTISFWIQGRLAVSAVNELMPAMIQASLAPDAGYEEIARNVFASAEVMSKAKKDMEFQMMIYPLIIMLRIFRSFEAQPRLAIVAATLKTAAPDLAHFFMIFWCVYFCFVVSSLLFFGQDLESFSTLDRALHTSFLAMFGDWDWIGMRDVGIMRSAAWFWLFMIVMVLFLLNMLLAIIMDAYQVEKFKASDTTTLWQQVLDMIQRRRQYQRSERVRLTDIFEVFRKQYKGKEKEMMSSDRMISVEYLVTHVTRMPYRQAYKTLVNALKRDEELSNGFMSEEQVNKQVESTLDAFAAKIQAVKDDVEFVSDQLDFWDRLQAPGDSEYDFYFGAEGHTPDEASKLWIHNSISSISVELQHLFARGLQRIGVWQDEFECEQSELNENLLEAVNRRLHGRQQGGEPQSGLILFAGPQTMGPLL